MNLQGLVEHKLIPQGVSGNDVIYACPKCEDPYSGHHLYVNYDKNKFHCFHCGFKGRSLSVLLRALNIDSGYDYERLYSDRVSDIEEVLNLKSTSKHKDSLVDYSTDLKVLTEYYKLHTKPLTESGYLYLSGRGIPDKMIYDLRLCEGVNRLGEIFTLGSREYQGRDYTGRIMIPSLRKDGLISFYLGRDYTGSKQNKYSNAPKDLSVASEDVWSLDILDSEVVVICEGVFTAIAVNNAVGKMISCATYGKSIANKSSDDTVRVTSQGEKLLGRKFKSYVMFYDKDALEESYKNGKYLHDRGANVRVVTIPRDWYGPKADAADMTREEVLQLLRESKPFDTFSEIDLM